MINLKMNRKHVKYNDKLKDELKTCKVQWSLTINLKTKL